MIRSANIKILKFQSVFIQAIKLAFGSAYKIGSPLWTQRWHLPISININEAGTHLLFLSDTVTMKLPRPSMNLMHFSVFSGVIKPFSILSLIRSQSIPTFQGRASDALKLPLMKALKSPHFWYYSTPLHAIASFAMYQNPRLVFTSLTYDHLVNIYPPLVKRHNYLYDQRDPLKRGLVFGHYLWEYGMDNYGWQHQ